MTGSEIVYESGETRVLDCGPAKAKQKLIDGGVHDMVAGNGQLVSIDFNHVVEVWKEGYINDR